MDGTGHGDAIRMESDVLMRALRLCRRQMQKERRQKKRGGAGGSLDIEVGSRSPTLVDENEKRCKEEDQHDNEGSIIDYYVHRMLAFVDAGEEDTKGMSPEFRYDIFVADGRPVQRIWSECWSPRHKASIYSASFYDADTDAPPSSIECDVGGQKSPSGVADEYIRLLGSEVGENSARGKEDAMLRREGQVVEQ
jgi:hypothetical protein